MGFRQNQGFDSRDCDLIRPGRVVLDPLTEVRIRVLVAVLVRSCELVMDPQRGSKRCQPKENQDHGQGYRSRRRRFGGSSSWQMEHGAGL